MATRDRGDPSCPGPLLAQSGHPKLHCTCPLSGVNQTFVQKCPENEAEPSIGRPCWQTDSRSKRTYDLTSSIVPRGTSFHHAVELEVFLLSDVVLLCSHAAAASFRVQLNSVPSTQMRCMITANRRASATIAFFMPRRLAICIAQALSHDHLMVRVNMLWAAS